MKNQKTSTTILMDHREAKNRRLEEALLSHPSVHLELTALKTGDFLIDDLLHVERKTLADFALSVKDGRLFRQAAQLAASKKYAVMVLEGTSRDMKTIGMKRKALQGALICLSLKFSIPVLRSGSPEETVWLMVNTSRHLVTFNRSKKHPGSRPAPAKRRDMVQQQLFILEGLPGIGPGRAKQLLKTFGSLKAVFSADIPAFKNVDGIGNRTAKKLWGVINAKYTST